MKITFPLDLPVIEALKASKDIAEHFKHLQPLLDREKILPDGTPFSSKVHNSRHVCRVAYLVKASSSIYRWLYNEFQTPEALQKLDNDLEDNLFYYQLAALFHDTGREGDGDDTVIWEQDSAINFYRYLTDILAISSEQALVYAECIINKDVSNAPGKIYHKMSHHDGYFSFNEAELVSVKPIGWILLHTADCLDVIRARKSFNIRFLDFYSLFIEHNKIAEMHSLLTALIRETTAIITLTGNDRFTANIEHAEFEATFYQKPEDAYHNLVNVIFERTDLAQYCQDRQLSFPYLLTLYRMAENNEQPEILSQFFELNKTLEYSSPIQGDFSKGNLWGGYPENLFKKIQADTKNPSFLMNAYRLISGGYIPSPMGVICEDLSLGLSGNTAEDFLTSFYKNYPKKPSDFFEYPVITDVNQIKGLYYQTDFKRRCTQWIRSKNEKQLPSEFFIGKYKLMLYIADVLFKEQYQITLPLYNINLSTGSLVLRENISFNELVQEMTDNIQALKEAILSRKIGVDSIEEVKNFFEENILIIENSCLNTAEKNQLLRINQYEVVTNNSELILTSRWSMIRKNIVENAKIINRFGLHLLTFHPATHFKREKYFPELLANTPEEYLPSEKIMAELDKEYTTTRYLSKPESDVYRIFIKNGVLVRRENHTPYSTEADNEIVCVTLKGEIYSAMKRNKLQHSSFTRGGHLLFSGNWHVESGVIKKINADSGHYEPSVVALQNFVYLLHKLGCQLEQARFLYSLRTMRDNPTSLNYYSKSPREIDLASLLSKLPKTMIEKDHLVTPAKLKILANMPGWRDKMFNIAKSQTEVSDGQTVSSVGQSDEDKLLTDSVKNQGAAKTGMQILIGANSATLFSGNKVPPATLADDKTCSLTNNTFV